MHVALFTDTFYPQINGVARTVERTAEMLVERGNTVDVYTVSGDPTRTRAHGKRAYEVIIIPSVPAGVYKGERLALPVGVGARVMKNRLPDVIHTHTPFGVGLEALRAAKRHGVPLVGTHHTFYDHYLKHVHLDFAWVQNLTWRYTAWYYNHCSLVLSPTQSLLDTMRDAGLYTRSKILVNPTRLSHFAPATESEKAFSKKSIGISGPTVLYLGRLSYEKSVDISLRAFTSALRHVPELAFVIAGDGPERAVLEKLSRELGVEEHVTFMGFVEGKMLTRVLHAADVCISASKSENMPLAILEALASGLPVVGVHSLGMNELVIEGENGFLVGPDDPEAMGKRIVNLSRDEELRSYFATRARASAARYDPETVGKELLDAYRCVRS